MDKTSDPKELAARSGGTSHADRVFRVQSAFAALGGDVHGPGAIATASGLDDSAVYRILQSGVYDGTFERVGRGQYRLAMGTNYLHAFSHTPGDAAHATLEELREATGQGLVSCTCLPRSAAPSGSASTWRSEKATWSSSG